MAKISVMTTSIIHPSTQPSRVANWLIQIVSTSYPTFLASQVYFLSLYLHVALQHTEASQNHIKYKIITVGKEIPLEIS